MIWYDISKFFTENYFIWSWMVGEQFRNELFTKFMNNSGTKIGLRSFILARIYCGGWGWLSVHMFPVELMYVIRLKSILWCLQKLIIHISIIYKNAKTTQTIPHLDTGRRPRGRGRTPRAASSPAAALAATSARSRRSQTAPYLGTVKKGGIWRASGAKWTFSY